MSDSKNLDAFEVPFSSLSATEDDDADDEVEVVVVNGMEGGSSNLKLVVIN